SSKGREKVRIKIVFFGHVNSDKSSTTDLLTYKPDRLKSTESVLVPLFDFPMAVEYQWHDHPLQLRSILSDSEPNASSASNPSQGTTTNAPKPTATSPSTSPASNYPSSPSTPSPSSSIHPTTPPATNASPPAPTLPTAAPPVPSFYTYTVPRNRGTSLTKSTTSLSHFQQIPQVDCVYIGHLGCMASAQKPLVKLAYKEVGLPSVEYESSHGIAQNHPVELRSDPTNDDRGGDEMSKLRVQYNERHLNGIEHFSHRHSLRHIAEDEMSKFSCFAC
ncbi:hypothetical protein RJ639_021673, partial [Escallonia herrerae]